MSLIASIIITLCSIFPVWVVAFALGLLTFVVVVIIIKLVAFVLDAVPFL